jgi:hypothetical protein
MTAKALNPRAVLHAYRELQADIGRLEHGLAVLVTQNRELLERQERFETERATWASERAELRRMVRAAGEAFIRENARKNQLACLVAEQLLSRIPTVEAPLEFHTMHGNSGN